MAAGSSPVRLRFRTALTLVPVVAGIATAIPLWGHKAQQPFFEAATHVLAIGAVALALQGRYFRLRPQLSGSGGDASAIATVLSTLVAVGVGLGFAFGALARGYASAPDLALTAGGLSVGVSTFAIQALFGTPGVVEDEDDT
jgi:hypothetical protein